MPERACHQRAKTRAAPVRCQSLPSDTPSVSTADMVLTLGKHGKEEGGILCKEGQQSLSRYHTQPKACECNGDPEPYLTQSESHWLHQKIQGDFGSWDGKEQQDGSY